MIAFDSNGYVRSVRSRERFGGNDQLLKFMLEGTSEEYPRRVGCRELK